MSLTIGSLRIAEARIQSVTLRPVLGAYELLFAVYLTVHGEKHPVSRASVIGARVTLTLDSGAHPLGFARPEQPIEIRTHASPSSMSPALILTLQPAQLAAIEERRGTADLGFELLATGLGHDGKTEHQIQDTWRTQVPRSNWIRKLREAGARDILLVEVLMPVRKRTGKWAGIARHLESAHDHLLDADYQACVATCRTVIQELGYTQFKKKEWADPALTRLTKDRAKMTGGEREAALWAALRHYTHPAHHGGSEGGQINYTRAEAKMALTLTAAFVARVQGR